MKGTRRPRRRPRATPAVSIAVLTLGACVGCGADPPVQRPATVAPASADHSLTGARQRAASDDAASGQEVLFHADARATFIRHVEPNRLGVGGAEFRVKRNPGGRGAFVYDPRVEHAGVTRNLVWWVPDEQGVAFPLNAPSQLVTPGLAFPAEAGLLDAPDTADVVGYVFRGETMTPQVAETATAPGETFTVREYRMYQALMDTPMSVSEEDGHRRIARRFDTTPEDVDRRIQRVLETLHRNGWFGRPAQEIRRASDWNGESP